MRAENPILQVKNLQVDFLVKKHTITAVKDVSFSVDKGTTLGIVGESGCGKKCYGNIHHEASPPDNTARSARDRSASMERTYWQNQKRKCTRSGVQRCL